MLNKQHLTEDGLHKIVALKPSINLGLPMSLQDVFNKVTPVERPLIQNQIFPDPSWLAGFVCIKIKQLSNLRII